MSVYFEKKVSLELIKLFLIYVFNIKEDDVKIFEQNYFFENGYLEVDDHIKCLCTYRYLTGDVNLIIDLYRIEDQSPKIMIERVKSFFLCNNWDGFIIVENIDDDYLKIGNSLIQSVRINDDLIEDDIVYFIDK